MFHPLLSQVLYLGQFRYLVLACVLFPILTFVLALCPTSVWTFVLLCVQACMSSDTGPNICAGIVACLLFRPFRGIV